MKDTFALALSFSISISILQVGLLSFLLVSVVVGVKIVEEGVGLLYDWVW